MRMRGRRYEVCVQGAQETRHTPGRTNELREGGYASGGLRRSLRARIVAVAKIGGSPALGLAEDGDSFEAPHCEGPRLLPVVGWQEAAACTGEVAKPAWQPAFVSSSGGGRPLALHGGEMQGKCGGGFRPEGGVGDRCQCCRGGQVGQRGAAIMCRGRSRSWASGAVGTRWSDDDMLSALRLGVES